MSKTLFSAETALSAFARALPLAELSFQRISFITFIFTFNEIPADFDFTPPPEMCSPSLSFLKEFALLGAFLPIFDVFGSPEMCSPSLSFLKEFTFSTPFCPFFAKKRLFNYFGVELWV
ncbi:hypothetical protein, partial [Pararhizobium sp.]|uniref:hypothetical protein n=1 Tax=Pararhizobium sp. TaxID=1977563 RepID=UPI002717926C